MEKEKPFTCPVCGHKFGFWQAFLLNYEGRIVCPDCHAHLAPVRNQFLQNWYPYLTYGIPLFVFPVYYLTKLWWYNNTLSFLFTVFLGLTFLFFYYEITIRNSYLKEI